MREILTADRYIKVPRDYPTIQAAIDYVVGSVDTQLWDVYIQVSEGTYHESLTTHGPLVGAGVLRIMGYGDPTKVILTHDALTTLEIWGTRTFISGFTIENLSANLDSIHVTRQANLQIGPNVRFGQAGAFHIDVDFCSTVMCLDGYEIHGGGRSHIAASLGGVFTAYGGTVTIVNNPSFAGAFAQANENGMLQATTTMYVGHAVGRKYDVHDSSCIYIGGRGQNIFPGSVPGVAYNGGVYA